MVLSRQVYVCLVEARPLLGCSFLDPRQHDGAMIRLYAVAFSRDHALERITGTLREDRFELAEIEWCMPFSEIERKDPNDSELVAFRREADASGNEIYGRIDAWEHEEPIAPEALN